MKSVHQIEPCGQIPVANTALVAMMESERKDQVHEAKVLLTRQKIDAAGKRSPAAAEVSPFNFGEHPVRVVVREGEPWFVAADVCAALDYVNPRKAVADHLDDDERSAVTVSDTRSKGGSVQRRSVVAINESGLYALVLRSRKPEARKFAKWVTSEVLPQIRKTGAYLPKEFVVGPGDVLTKEQQDVLRQLVKSTVDRLPKPKQGGAAVKMWSKLQAHFGVAYRDIPQQEFTEAVSLLTRAATEWELVDDDDQAAKDEAVLRERQEKAFAMAAQVAAAASRTVFQAVMSGAEDIESNRWVFGLGQGHFGPSDVQGEPWASMVPRDACIASLQGLAKMIDGPGGLMPEQGDLITLMFACMNRIRAGLPPELRI